MITTHVKRIFLCLLIAYVSAGNVSNVYSQATKASLTAEKKKIEKELAEQKKALWEVQKNKKTSLREVQILSNQIRKQEQLIQTMSTELSCLDVEINTISQEIVLLQSKLNELIKEYEKAIYIAYKYRNVLSKVSFVISADNVHQALKRMRYLHEYSNSLKRQLLIIKDTQEKKKKKEESLILAKQEKEHLLEDRNKEKTNLQQQQGEKNRVVNSLKKREKDINAEINRKIRRQKAIDNQIAKIIEAQLAAAKKTAVGKTPEADVALANDFANNQGKLPWPVERGTIITNFGTYSHPEVSSVKITNNGINILTDKLAPVRAVFKGKVSTISVIDGANVVIISHGTYLSVYSNLGNVNVKIGDQVSTKQVIGTMKLDPNDNKSELHFEIRKERTPLNPALWISR